MRLTLLTFLAFVTGCTRTPIARLTAGQDAAVVEGVTALREATASFQSLDSAVQHGYPRTVPDCLVHAQHGAMGYHHVNRAIVDNTLDVRHPEILLYQRLDDGSYRLNGVEFIVPFRTWPRDSTPPVLMGRTLHREDNLHIWYMHVWAWTPNPDGLFANFNPAVSCLPGTGKIYAPFEASP